MSKKCVYNIFRYTILVCAVLLPVSCRSINCSRAKLGIPQSMVFLSFDDGPNSHADTTARLLDVLKKHDVKAMFALLGENVEHNPGLAGRIAEEGHCVINHGYSDTWASTMDANTFTVNLLEGERAITGALGHELKPKLYRPQGGFYRAGQETICRDEGYALVLSNERVYDAVLTGIEREKVVAKLLKKTEKQGGGIILLHDARDSHFRMEQELAKAPLGSFNRSWIPEVVEELIVALRAQGYIIGTPGDYFSQQGL